MTKCDLLHHNTTYFGEFFNFHRTVYNDNTLINKQFRKPQNSCEISKIPYGFYFYAKHNGVFKREFSYSFHVFLREKQMVTLYAASIAQ